MESLAKNRSHWIGNVLQTSLSVERSARRSHLVESSDTKKLPCSSATNKSHPAEDSATNKSPCREFGYKQLTKQGCLLQTNHLVESSATNPKRVQLQPNHPVERSARNKLQRSARRSHLVESSATNKPPCREFSYKGTILYRV